MKKILSLFIALSFVVGTLSALTACNKKGTTKDDNGKKELALITDVGTINDKSFNQGAWEGLKKYAEEKKISHKYYKPAEKSDVAYKSAIDQAVKGGAKVVVCPGFLFEKSVYEKQTQYPDVKFILLDGVPHKGDYKPVIEKNTLSIFYAEEQAGYLAGYAAVVEGYKKLGFMGGMAVPAVIRYGYGFVQGADAAAKEMGMKKGDIDLKYTYVNNFDATPENQAKAASWFNDGTELIFGCGGAVGNSVMKAAESANKVVIGVDVDQSSESKTVITSAMKNLGKSVYDAIADYYDDKFDGGKSITLDAKQEGVELPMESSKFKKFGKKDYEKIYKSLEDGSVKLMKDTDVKSAADIPTQVVKVTVIK